MLFDAIFIIFFKLVTIVTTFVLLIQSTYRALERKTRVPIALALYFLVATISVFFGLIYDLMPSPLIAVIPVASTIITTVPFLDFSITVFHSKRMEQRQNKIVLSYGTFCFAIAIYGSYMFVVHETQLPATPIILIVTILAHVLVTVDGLHTYVKAKRSGETDAKKILLIAIGSFTVILGFLLVMLDSASDVGLYTEKSIIGYSLLILGYNLIRIAIVVRDNVIQSTLKIAIIITTTYFVGYIAALLLYPTTLLPSQGISYLGVQTINGNPNPSALVFMTTMIIVAVSFLMYGWMHRNKRWYGGLFLLIGSMLFLVALPYDIYPTLHDIGAILCYLLFFVIMVIWCTQHQKLKPLIIGITIFMGILLLIYAIQIPMVMAVGGILQQIYLALFFVSFIVTDLVTMRIQKEH